MQYRFNVRVYGIWIDNGQLLVNEELIRGRQVIKFPGGGLDWGEGTVDCLKREWKEELDLDIAVGEHFYTTDFFQESAYDKSQVISIYYMVSGQRPEVFTNLVSNERTYWVDLKMVSEDTFTLGIDRRVGHLLHQKYNR
jgi:ADP-ribose pyrophosphatase YjhB (NUDIX family)